MPFASSKAIAGRHVLEKGEMGLTSHFCREAIEAFGLPVDLVFVPLKLEVCS